ncbi:MAG: tRNA 4-thiouridine(8) synthase ThiI [Firmicutes bacterium]|nr:tRNA 4-thiouridine(8) synthase ThiI [Bacillota bacterium]
MTTAIALLSGGLDSQLAVKVIQEQGIEVIGVNFKSPFFGAAPPVYRAAEQLEIPLQILDLNDVYMDVLKNPRYGYGKNLNPCIDCHGLMLQRAGQYMEEIKADFLITGEVLKQRPKSQHRDALRIVEKLSGYPGLILRPLSAKLLPLTIPEEKGLVDRARLLDISGRSRKPQIELAKKYGLRDYPSPGGGCLLTVPSFANRLRRLLTIKSVPTSSDLELLKVGRHFYFDQFPGWLIIGRKSEENEQVKELAQAGDILLKVVSHPGPTTLVRPLNPVEPIPHPVLETAAGLTARYSDAQNLKQVEVKCWPVGTGEEQVLVVSPLQPNEITGIEQV